MVKVALADVNKKYIYIYIYAHINTYEYWILVRFHTFDLDKIKYNQNGHVSFEWICNYMGRTMAN